jgi:hypothetical protein
MSTSKDFRFFDANIAIKWVEATVLPLAATGTFHLKQPPL